MHSKRRRVMQSLLFSVALATVLSLSACASSSASSAKITPTSSATPSPTATPLGLQPTPIKAIPGDVSMCAVVSPSDFAQVAGTTATEITSGATSDSLTGLAEVYCIYDDASDSSQLFARGTINYEFAGDAQAAEAIFASVKQAFSGVSNVPGIGDSAFAGSPAGASGGTGLLVLRGNLLLYLSVAGDKETVVHVSTALAALVLARVA